MKQNLKINRSIDDKVAANPPKSRKEKKRKKKFRKHTYDQDCFRFSSWIMDIPKRKNIEIEGEEVLFKSSKKFPRTNEHVFPDARMHRTSSTMEKKVHTRSIPRTMNMKCHKTGDKEKFLKPYREKKNRLHIKCEKWEGQWIVESHKHEKLPQKTMEQWLQISYRK